MTRKVWQKHGWVMYIVTGWWYGRWWQARQPILRVPLCRRQLGLLLVDWDLISQRTVHKYWNPWWPNVGTVLHQSVPSSPKSYRFYPGSAATVIGKSLTIFYYCYFIFCIIEKNEASIVWVEVWSIFIFLKLMSCGRNESNALVPWIWKKAVDSLIFRLFAQYQVEMWKGGNKIRTHLLVWCHEWVEIWLLFGNGGWRKESERRVNLYRGPGFLIYEKWL